jgi:hypothetical protein
MCKIIPATPGGDGQDGAIGQSIAPSSPPPVRLGPGLADQRTATWTARRHSTRDETVTLHAPRMRPYPSEI